MALRADAGDIGRLAAVAGHDTVIRLASNPDIARAVMNEANINEMDFSFDFDGSVVLLRDR